MLKPAPVKLDYKTKNLTTRLEVGDIAVIKHKDIDEIAAKSLASKKVAAVINCSQSISGGYPNLGPTVFINHNIPLYELEDGDLFRDLKEGDIVEIRDDGLYRDESKMATLKSLNTDMLLQLLEQAEKNIKVKLEEFVDNTLTYASMEKSLILEEQKLPDTGISFQGRHVLVVVRGKTYKEDLKAILSYIKDEKPILIAVDGGGDALLEFGFTPDIVVGDMDSISDECLKKAREVIVHAYPDGRAPGLERTKGLKLSAKVFPAYGTSEDIAMLFAYEKGAELIVAVGTHTNMIDFLEKGRKGMGSTFLVRMKIGTKLVDAKGVSQLYGTDVDLKHVLWLGAASLIPILVLVALSQPIQYLVKLLHMRLRLYLGY
ncbi:putative cytokinetic ring protein SteA [Alkaliphilus hydrothermalis]|uniref:Membrane-anchored protein n=1 Tax=Alkaliphilus hydrothermalis TaxID=1482730 RepID=A0ABS2NN63_9FIRM|nr:putative cytokinetic ring protein SteA [Alkaliphilus hydrothermalis]MBM7614019.1 putative membrane-anchored protein [Alkaliphilus hydrothermalis]